MNSPFLLAPESGPTVGPLYIEYLVK
jgi:hypothetical protein